MGRPKQFLPLAGRPVVEWCLELFKSMPEVAEIALVMTPENVALHGARLSGGKVRVGAGGATRLQSVKNGVALLGAKTDVVAVHDGARPLLSAETARAVFAAAAEHGAAVAAVPCKDTLKESPDKAWVARTPNRSDFWQAQTPQAYRRDVLAAALGAHAGDEDASDESQVVERAGTRVRLVPSSYENLKVTTPEDLAVAEALLRSRAGGRRIVRAGFGYDVHRLVEGRELWLAGVKLEHPKGLLGHSDGDVVLHAAADAVLGALGAGEIGMMFPPEDPRHKGVASRLIAARVLEILRERGGEILSLDATVISEEPKLRPHYARLAAGLADSFGLEPARVNFKAKSNEKLGEIGRGEAMACHAVASVEAPA
jgi:2-C-methyl-D-erythritol 4-phosphate cytidylyltransferase/2-C-methyl-D-erythritol 2,4-cyclodiphosphate synthase